MYSWCSPIAGQVTCRSRESDSPGNHSRTSSCHSPSLFAGPPGAIPAATAGATYLRIVFRSTPSESDISFSDLPACQCTSISVTSITSNVLLAIGPPSSTGGKIARSRWPGPPRHARRPHGELRDRGGELRDRYTLRTGELQDRRHPQAARKASSFSLAGTRLPLSMSPTVLRGSDCRLPPRCGNPAARFCRSL